MTDEIDDLFINEMERAWAAVCGAPTPEAMFISRRAYKEIERAMNTKRPGKYPWTEITVAQRDALGIPEKSAPARNPWWAGNMCTVDKRCLKRYQRRARK